MHKKKSSRSVNGHCTSLEFLETSVVMEEVDGVTIQRVVTKNRNVLDPSSMPTLPTRDEMSLENMLAAGVPLKDIPCGTLLNPTDMADLQEAAGRVCLSAISRMPEETPTPSEVVETPSPSVEVPSVTEPSNS